jgi:hypothetical protein
MISHSYVFMQLGWQMPSLTENTPLASPAAVLLQANAKVIPRKAMRKIAQKFNPL